jgi:hypothetical protein
VRRTPGQNEVARWIAEAATLPKVVTHGGAGHRSSAEHGTAKVAQSAQVPAHMPAEDAEPAADESAQVPASEPALEAVAAPTEPAVPAMRPEPATPQPKGLWARIKRTWHGVIRDLPADAVAVDGPRRTTHTVAVNVEARP